MRGEIMAHRYLRRTVLTVLAACSAGALTLTPVAVADQQATGVSPIVPGHLPYPSGGTSVLGVGIDQDRTNSQLAETLSLPVARGWTPPPSPCQEGGVDSVGSVVVVGSRLYVVSGESYCAYVTAYDLNSKTMMWRAGPTRFNFGLRADVASNTLYTAVDTGEPFYKLLAYDLNSGALKWSTSTLSLGYNAPLTVGAGVIGGAQEVYQQSSGAKLYNISKNFNNASNTISDGILLNNQGLKLRAVAASTGAGLWDRPMSAPGTTVPPQVASGRVYVANQGGTLVFDLKTGRQYPTLPASSPDIAIDGDVGIFSPEPFNASQTVSAASLSTAHVYWTFAEKTGNRPNHYYELNGRPIVANGLVWFTEQRMFDGQGYLVALDEVSGTVKLRQALPCGAGPVTIAQHRLLMPSQCGLLTWSSR